MNEIKLLVQEDRALTFVGELIARQSTQVPFSDSVEGLITLTLYAVSGGGFVPVVEFTSPSAIVEDVIDAEQVDLAKDVECFLLLFDPTEHVDLLAHTSRSSRPFKDQTFGVMLTKKYYGLVDNLLATLVGYQASHPGCEVVYKKRPKETSRFWNFFGLRQE